MLHRILTVLTTAAVALHALLGCCAHHAHADNTQPPRQDLAAAVAPVSCCAHGQRHAEPAARMHDDSAQRDSHVPAEPGCNEGDCSFVPVQRSTDAEAILAASQCEVALADLSPGGTGLPNSCRVRFSESRPPILLSPSSARALIQVWRL